MGRNLFTYALMGAADGGLSSISKSMDDEQKAARDLEARKAMLELQNEAFMERRGGVPVGQGGGTGARVAVAPMTAERANADVNAMSRATDDELEPFVPANANRAMAPGYSQSEVLDPRDAAAQVTYGPDGQPLPAGEKPKMVLDRSDPAVADGLRRLQETRMLIYSGPNADNFAKGREGLATANLIERAGKGEQVAGDALLRVKGKDPAETAARAKEAEADARKADRTDPNIRRGSGGGAAAPGPKPVTGVDLERALRAAEKELANALGVPTNRVNEELATLKRKQKLTPEQADAEGRWRTSLKEVQKLNRNPGGEAPAPGPAPAQSPAAPAKSPYKEGQKLRGADGKTYIVKGGVPVLSP